MSQNSESGRKTTIAGSFVTLGLGVATLAIVVGLIASLYSSLSGQKDFGLLANPEIVAAAVGLIISVLFVERLRSLEERVNLSTQDVHDTVETVRKSLEDQIGQSIGQSIESADRLNTQIKNLTEHHPWLEEISKREILVETSSIRGILRSAEVLLREERFLHLFEYFEYCSKRDSLQGTVDDFLEIAEFCEVWLGDEALALAFLERGTKLFGSSIYAIRPFLLVRLVRVGYTGRVEAEAVHLERALKRDHLLGRFPWLRRTPFGGRFPRLPELARWRYHNSLALAFAFLGETDDAVRELRAGQRSPFAQRFASEQLVMEAEINAHAWRFTEALDLLARLDVNADDSADSASRVFRMRDEIFILERIGEFKAAAQKRLQMSDVLDSRIAAWQRQELRETPGKSPDLITLPTNGTGPHSPTVVPGTVEHEVQPTKGTGAKNPGEQTRAPAASVPVPAESPEIDIRTSSPEPESPSLQRDAGDGHDPTDDGGRQK